MGWIALEFKRLARVFSNTTIQRHQFLGAQFFILIIPPVPSASYDASGFVMTSIFLILAAGMVDRSLIVVGIPSINTRILEFPRIEIFSSEIFTEEDERRISIAEPLLDTMFDEAFRMVRSTDDFCETFCADTTTSLSDRISSLSVMVPTFK